jgi:hypothetical protein
MLEITIQNAFSKQDFRFRENDKITIDFLNSLKVKDLFCFHCRDIAEYLGFKRADKHFREAFDVFLQKYGLIYIVARSPITQNRLDWFFNAEKIVKNDNELNESCKNIAQRTGETFNEVCKRQADLLRKCLGSVEINEKHQKLSTGNQSGCWLILYKQF